MKSLDRYLREVRIAKARAFVRPGDVVVDVGCADGAMFDRLGATISHGYGIDPSLTEQREGPGYELYPGAFPDDLPPLHCDVITMLAVLEHIPTAAQVALGEACHALLNPGGRVVITVPSPRVDQILAVLARLRLIDGMKVEEHYGFEPARTAGPIRPAAFPSPAPRSLPARAQ